jgi:hypothetical protein
MARCTPAVLAKIAKKGTSDPGTQISHVKLTYSRSSSSVNVKLQALATGEMCWYLYPGMRYAGFHRGEQSQIPVALRRLQKIQVHSATEGSGRTLLAREEIAIEGVAVRLHAVSGVAAAERKRQVFEVKECSPALSAETD